MAMFFLKNKKYSNPECFISKKYRERFFRCENFSSKDHSSRAVELAISFY